MKSRIDKPPSADQQHEPRAGDFCRPTAVPESSGFLVAPRSWSSLIRANVFLWLVYGIKGLPAPSIRHQLACSVWIAPSSLSSACANLARDEWLGHHQQTSAAELWTLRSLCNLVDIDGRERLLTVGTMRFLGCEDVVACFCWHE